MRLNNITYGSRNLFTSHGRCSCWQWYGRPTGTALT